MSDTGHQQHIFVSYCRIDNDFSLKLVVDLKNSGVRVWMDRLDGGIRGGDDWRRSIEQAITEETCVAVVAVLSPSYITREYCRNELARANRLKIPIYPLLLYPVPDDKWPLEIERLQYVDFTYWSDDQVYVEQLKKLLIALRHRFPAQISDEPDAETQYLTSLIAELETRRGVLEYVELAAETSTPQGVRPNLPIDDEWGFEELIEAKQQPEPQKIPLKSIAEAVAKHPRFVLIGEPGAGKTTAIRQLALQAARRRLDNPRTAPLPLLLYLPQWSSEPSPIEFVQTKWPLDGNLLGLLKHGDVLLFLDGLNEMGAEGSRKAKLLRTWIESADSPAHLIITCRAGDYAGELKLGKLPTVLAQELEPEQIRQFVTNYLKEKAAGLLVHILPSDEDVQRMQFVHETIRQKIEARSLLRLARNPYMLSALIVIYGNSPEGELPRNMGTLFKKLVRALWMREVRRGTTDEKSFKDAELAFARLAFRMIDEDQPVDVPVAYALDKIGSLDLLRTGTHAAFVVFDGEYVRFYHQLLLEYFAAVELDNLDISGIFENISKVRHSPHGMYGELVTSKWDQVVISLCGLTAIPDTHLRKLAAMDTYLAAKWLTSGVKLSPSVYDETLSLILQEADRFPMYAARTVFSILADAKEPRVVVPLIKLLPHGNYHRVGSKASDALIRLGAEAVPELIGALKDPNSVVRVRVAAILGRIKDERAVPALIELLSDKEGDGWGKPRYACDVAAWALKGIGTRQALEAFHKWRANLVDTLHRFGSDVDSGTLWSIQELFEWDHDDVRQELERVFDANSISKLCENLTYASIEILMVIGNSVAVNSLEHALKIAADRDDDQMIKLIIEALEHIGTPQALQARWAAAKG